jgi:4-amino-4-deoxy-L-arabinose transferase-like glycosyltransferase
VYGVILALGVILILVRLLATGGKTPPKQAPDSRLGQAWLCVAAAAALLGLALRLWKWDESLWLDEFGTWWVVQSDLPAVIARTLEFQGQSPFYYLIVWLFAQVFGENEIALRLPSLIAGVAACWFVYKTAAELLDARTGLFAAAMFWLSSYPVQCSAEARPYSLVLFFAAAMLWGFVRAALRGDWAGRGAFILAGAGLVATHYLAATLPIAIGAAWLCTPELRHRYAAKPFFQDVGLQLLLVTPLLAQLWAVWGRRASLDMNPDTHFLILFPVAGPMLLAALVGWAGTPLSTQHTTSLKSVRPLLWLAALAPALILIGLKQAWGINLLLPRYTAVAAVPAAVLAGIQLRNRAAPVGVLAVGLWLAITGAGLAAQYRQVGAFTRTNGQDWRGGTALAAQQIDRDSVVFFRSGFVEDDLWAKSDAVSDAVFAPLHSPGSSKPPWKPIPLTFRWNLEGRQEYLERVAAPRIRGARDFYYFSCLCSTNPDSKHYEERFSEWVENEFPGQFVRESREDAGKNIVFLQFRRRAEISRLQVRDLPGDGSQGRP